MGDREITEAIREYLKEIQVGGISAARHRFCLKFNYNGTSYETCFSAVHDDEAIAVQNQCIHMAFEYMDEKGTPQHKFIGRIDTDSDERKCFSPILKTNARNKVGQRTTSADVLQILKTKLGLAFPIAARVNINDGAQKDRIMIAPFNILRGGNAFYEKYGYRSEPISDLKTKIQTFIWKDCNDAIKSVVHECTGRSDWAPDMRLMDIMKTISWEQEKAYNNVKGKIEGEEEEDFIHPSLSYRVFRHFATIAAGITFEQTYQFSAGGIWEFWLNPLSDEWKRCDAELVFTNFIPVVAGGSRRSRKNKRTRRTTRRHRRRT